MYEDVIKNRFGFYELKEKPDPEALERYYAEKYYQSEHGNYRKEYSPEAREYLRKRIQRKYRQLPDDLLQRPERRFLDIGCGEGWALSFFNERGWQVQGLDYSMEGIRNFHPELTENVSSGNIYQNIDQLEADGQTYHLMLLDNVLEHVLEPFALAKQLSRLAEHNGYLIVESPNDFSVLHRYLMNKGHIRHPFWVVSPDHISYFNAEGLEKMMHEAGWELVTLSCDFPIGLNLLNPDTNYVEDRSKGKNAHQSRIELMNLLDQISQEKTDELFRLLADMGLGRNLIAYFKKS